MKNQMKLYPQKELNIRTGSLLDLYQQRSQGASFVFMDSTNFCITTCVFPSNSKQDKTNKSAQVNGNLIKDPSTQSQVHFFWARKEKQVAFVIYIFNLSAFPGSRRRAVMFLFLYRLFCFYYTFSAFYVLILPITSRFNWWWWCRSFCREKPENVNICFRPLPYSQKIQCPFPSQGYIEVAKHTDWFWLIPNWVGCAKNNKYICK